MIRFAALLISCLTLMSACAPGGQTDREPPVLQGWVMPIEVRVYRGSFTREPDNRSLEMAGLAGEVLSGQVVVRSTADIETLAGAPGDLTGPGGATIPASGIQVRYGGYVPVDETMTMTADPLLEEESVSVQANYAQPVWITVDLPVDQQPGVYNGKFTATADPGGSVEFDVSLEVLPVVLPPAPEWSFYLNIWQDPNGVARAHEVEPWSEQHWTLLERYADNLAAHGMNSIMTSIIHDPWRGQSGYTFDSMVEWSYPGEFTRGEADQFEWDFTIFDRYVSLMMEAGVRDKIDLYALVKGPGGTLDASIRYLDTVSGNHRTIEMDVGQDVWKEVWRAFLPVLKEHLKEKGWFDVAVLGCDEKPERIMDIVFEFVHTYAPEFKIASSGGYPGDENMRAEEIVFPIDDLTNNRRWENVRPIVEEMAADPNRYVTWYTACWPRYPNTFIFSHLRQTRFIGWVTWKFGFDGYTRWAVNAFPEDVWTQPRFKWPSGDMFFVYPGEDGPLDSMRWELLRQSIQDYEALRMAMELAREAGREDLVEKLDEAVDRASVFDSCGWIPYAAESRAVVNDVIRELAG